MLEQNKPKIDTPEWIMELLLKDETDLIEASIVYEKCKLDLEIRTIYRDSLRNYIKKKFPGTIK